MHTSSLREALSGLLLLSHFALSECFGKGKRRDAGAEIAFTDDWMCPTLQA